MVEYDGLSVVGILVFEVDVGFVFSGYEGYENFRLLSWVMFEFGEGLFCMGWWDYLKVVKGWYWEVR